MIFLKRPLESHSLRMVAKSSLGSLNLNLSWVSDKLGFRSTAEASLSSLIFKKKLKAQSVWDEGQQKTQVEYDTFGGTNEVYDFDSLDPSTLSPLEIIPSLISHWGRTQDPWIWARAHLGRKTTALLFRRGASDIVSGRILSDLPQNADLSDPDEVWSKSSGQLVAFHFSPEGSLIASELALPVLGSIRLIAE